MGEVAVHAVRSSRDDARTPSGGSDFDGTRHRRFDALVGSVSGACGREWVRGSVPISLGAMLKHRMAFRKAIFSWSDSLSALSLTVSDSWTSSPNRQVGCG